tara:strand:+ start:671 stop:868 length:198 start_codon:yes stop_codon:yes gene_type:complete
MYGKTRKLPKPFMKPKKELSKQQKELLKQHKPHHTNKHMDEMKKHMKKGFCFQQAHTIAMKNVGK